MDLQTVGRSRKLLKLPRVNKETVVHEQLHTPNCLDPDHMPELILTLVLLVQAFIVLSSDPEQA